MLQLSTHGCSMGAAINTVNTVPLLSIPQLNVIVKLMGGLWLAVSGAAELPHSTITKENLALAMATVIESILYDPAPFCPLKITAKRYTRPQSSSFNDPTAYTLILTHGIGFHCEYWEPTLERLFQLSHCNEQLGRKGGFRIREAWSINNVNHGDSAELNVEELQKEQYDKVSGALYGQAIHLFLSNGSAFGHDFSGHQLVGVGHSFGSIGFIHSLTLTPNYLPPDQSRPIDFHALVLCEPMVYPPEEERVETRLPLLAIAKVRRTHWKSREEAYEYMNKSRAYKRWDPIILKKFVEYGLVDLPSPLYPPTEKSDMQSGVAIKCTPRMEMACYLADDEEGGPKVKPFNVLHRVCSMVRECYAVFAEIPDLTPQTVRDATTNPSRGNKFVDISTVKGAGHLVVHMKPLELADHIFAHLETFKARVDLKGRQSSQQVSSEGSTIAAPQRSPPSVVRAQTRGSGRPPLMAKL